MIVTIQEFNNQFRVTIPRHIMKLMNWEKNTELIFLIDETFENISLKKIENGKIQHKKKSK